MARRIISAVAVSASTCSFRDIASAVRRLRCKEAVTAMTNKPNPSLHSLPGTRTSADTAAATTDEDERLRRAAEEVREAAELQRAGQEVGREVSEQARKMGEESRVAADAARHALVDSLRQTAAALEATLARMTVVEEMRREFHQMRVPGKSDS
jgi:hypothetical protein